MAKRPAIPSADPYAKDEALYDRLREVLRFEKTNLDQALEEQPILFEQVADRVAWAINRREMAREDQKLVEARIDQEVRDGSEYKITEKQVAALIEQHPQYIEARREYKQASYWADRWEGLKDAYRNRGMALRDLVQLHVTGHYQTGQTGQMDYQQIRREMAEQRRTK